MEDDHAQTQISEVTRRRNEDPDRRAQTVVPGTFLAPDQRYRLELPLERSRSQKSHEITVYEKPRPLTLERQKAKKPVAMECRSRAVAQHVPHDASWVDINGHGFRQPGEVMALDSQRVRPWTIWR